MTLPSQPAADLGFQHVFEPGANGWTVLLLHGTGGDEHDLLPLGRALAPGAALLSPRGKVLERGMPRFFRRLAVGQFDIPDLLSRTDELAGFVEAAIATYELESERIVALGLSNGANIAASLLLRRPGLLRGAALLRAVLPFTPERPAQLAGVDVLIASGSEDPHAPPAEAKRLAQLLTAAGARVSAHTEPHAGHALTQGDLALTARWLTGLTGAATA
jgi:predicted esterase